VQSIEVHLDKYAETKEEHIVKENVDGEIVKIIEYKISMSPTDTSDT
jgi:hypothetical protein